MANNGNLELFLGGGILFLFSKKIFLKEKLCLTPNEISLIFRWFVMFTYGMAGFHKLNYDFFNLDVSCTHLISQNLISNVLGEEFNFSAVWTSLFIHLTFFFELVVPVGLFFYKTRKISAILLLIFIFSLGLNNVANFTAYGVVIIIGSVLDFNSLNTNTKIYNASRVLLFFALVGILVNLTWIALFPYPKSITRVMTFPNLAGCLIFSAGLSYFILQFIKHLKVTKQKINQSFSYKIVLPVVFLWCFGFQAYIGLSNTGNLTMFSNLITEKSRNNHLLIDTKKTKIFDFEEDNIEIFHSSIEIQREFYDKYFQGRYTEYLYPMIEVKKNIKQALSRTDKKLFIYFKYNGKYYYIKDVKNSPLNNSKWWHRYVFLRGIQKERPNRCQW
ncbi:MAG: hypothetical protein H6604_05375 [Flavobacteriales bacterium]|nr:hypothetical protein [Flavobacteriales bacterium]